MICFCDVTSAVTGFRDMTFGCSVCFVSVYVCSGVGVVFVDVR